MADISVIKMPNNQSYNVKDATARQNINDLIKISDTQPSSTATKIWITETAPDPVQVPTVSEMNTAIATAIGEVNSFDIAIIQILPTENIREHTIYFVPKTGDTNDVYDEYVYINNAWEMIGNTQIDLSNYATKNEIPEVPVQDIQINGTSIINNGIAQFSIAAQNRLGLVQPKASYGTACDAQGNLAIFPAGADAIKIGTASYQAIVPASIHTAAFYGLAKAAGDTTQTQSDNAVGIYTDEAKTAILNMFGLQLATNEDIQTIISGGAGA